MCESYIEAKNLIWNKLHMVEKKYHIDSAKFIKDVLFNILILRTEFMSHLCFFIISLHQHKICNLLGSNFLCGVLQ